jgi:cytochrome P450
MEAKRNKPDDSFISGMMQENESCDEPLTHNELISVFILVFFAGIETSVYLIAQGLYYLMLDEKSMAWFRENPGLSGKAVEELIRFSSPSQYAPRVAATDILVQDQLIKKGDKVMGCIASANRDPRVFENPDSLMLNRQKNPHLGFGFGMHHCIGAKLAREEMNLLFPALLSAFHTIQFHPAKKHVWDTMIINRGLHSLPAQLSW